MRKERGGDAARADGPARLRRRRLRQDRGRDARAMLAVLSKKQVAVLVPTTVLAEQHERTFRERFKGYPVRIEALSRMKSAEEAKRS